MRNYEDLEVWQKAHALLLDIMPLTRGYPEDERFGLAAQTRSAGRGIPGAIVEGSGRRTDRDMARFLDISAGSASELEYWLRVAVDLGYIHRVTHDPLRARVQEIRRMLYSLADYLRHSGPKTDDQD
ncbi:MAG TPA: four helix bundle protein [Longimicrobiales bacterium]|nr:four helix bundle protein [Longimicrobiales bacterium]